VTASTATVVPPAIAPAGRRLEPVPRRADGVELIGELAGSGYRRTPALARRADGQLIKLTPLLYRLIETIDGRRDYDEIAAELTRRVGKNATADDVRYLVEKKLRPLGILRRADGGQPQVQRANPLLAIRPRIVVSKQEWTNRLTTPFLWLFSPLVVLPMVSAFALITIWLLTDKGLASAIHEAFYEPSMLLLVWVLVLLSAAFHEIGHATACRYGGARPGVMGAGLYLVWPTFYTEVSDAYRLDRRGRLRVDLGGLYFSAIFAVGTAGAWALTADDALLLVIAVQVLQMVRQLAPFVRADGYHVMADLIGVPDLFAHIKPTLLGLLPTRWGRPENQVLKPWARAAVALWVLIVVPVLVVTLGMMVLALPRLIGTAWDSMGLRWAETTGLWSDGDLAGVIASGISTAIVALPVLGILYLLARLGRRTATRTWQTTQGRPLMRMAALAGATMLAGVLAWAWWPHGQYEPISGDEAGPIPTIAGPELTVTAPQPVSYTVSAPAAQAASASAAPAAPPQAVPPASLTWQERRGTSAAGRNPGDAPASPARSDDAWPFPFDPPAPPEPGDNRSMAVNLVDGSSLTDLAASLLLVMGGDPVTQENAAHAYASCSDCRTVAIAFQVILILGYTDQITPINGAVAANYNCDACDTLAFAYQIIATLTRAPDDQLQQQLAAMMERLQELEANLDSMTDEEIYLELEDIQNDLLDALDASGTLATSAAGPTSASALAGVTAASQADGDGASAGGATGEDAPAEPDSTAEPAPEGSSDGSTTTTTQDPATEQPPETTTTDQSTTTTTETTTTTTTTTTDTGDGSTSP
jgi:putative peptide zinc metalloprotease protein